jgi:predicted Holliday junction resolvase-like endonuclease
MLVLFETPAGFALFKVLDEGKLSKVEVMAAATSLLSVRARVCSRCLFRFVG